MISKIKYQISKLLCFGLQNSFINKIIIRPLVLSFLSGILLFLSFPNANLYFLVWIALIPLMFIIQTENIRVCVFSGLISGFTAYVGILYWIFPMMKFNTGSNIQSIACLFSLSAYLAVYIAVWMAFLKLFHSHNPVIANESKQSDPAKAGSFPSVCIGNPHLINVFTFSIFGASLWVALEYARTYFLSGFPWALLGYSQWKFLPLIQIAEWTGVYGISFVIVATNILMWQFILRRRLPVILALSALISAILIFGSFLKTKKTPDRDAPGIIAAVIQGNIDQYKKWNVDYENEILQTYSSLVCDAASKKPDIVVWPETAVPGYVPSDKRLNLWLSAIAKKTGCYNIVGAPFNDGSKECYNSTLLVNPEGKIAGVHKKTHLVPFGEYVPLRRLFEPYFGVLSTIGDFTRNREISVFRLKSVMIGATICSENFFGNIVRQFVLKGAEIIVNQTNDAWFFKTSAARQHFIMNVFRSIENRRYTIVCGNTGVSAIVNTAGMISCELPIFTTQYFVSRVPLLKIGTFYTQFGDIFAKICIGAAILFLIDLIRRIMKIHSCPN